MKIEYDKEADALYIQLKEAHVEDNIDIEIPPRLRVSEYQSIRDSE